jgi:hypothetical protein
MAATPQQADAALRKAFAGIKVIDTDTHLSEPFDLWTSRAPAKFKDRVPQVREIKGKPTWVINGDVPLGGAGPVSVIRKNGEKIRGWGFARLRMEEAHPGCFDIKERLRYMDESGVWAQIIYPNFLGFGGQRATQLPEDLRLLCFQIYNDAMAELQQESGNRMFPMTMLPWWDIELSVKEAIRCHKMGLRGVNMNNHPQSPTWGIATGIGCGRYAATSICRSISISVPAMSRRRGSRRCRGPRCCRTRSLPWARRCCSSTTPGCFPICSTPVSWSAFPN